MYYYSRLFIEVCYVPETGGVVVVVVVVVDVAVDVAGSHAGFAAQVLIRCLELIRIKSVYFYLKYNRVSC